MGTLAQLLMGLVAPMVLRGLAALGFTAVTFTGVQLVVDQLIAQAQSSWSAVPTAMLQMASLAGLPESIGLICGAYIARITLWSAANATKLLFTGKT
ncbi:hypothetical protein RD110_10290 [Rhodoferax koreense]|uniref:Cobalt ABC transporter permease n=1 Tax=Rhodoferax koreensis TaxID=1842727 RepID=A0A1P8JUW6_9BURK|nr:DUF2523 domain-containing protein [Rhodoferax koreense]APW37528.1 hypothetical protein RD110_10290 [Rhodoferax koreense]